MTAGLALFWLLAGSLTAAPPAPPTAEPERARIRAIVKEVLREYAATLGDRKFKPETTAVLANVIADNRDFVRRHGPQYFRPFVDTQKPRATLVTCSDSRVHTHALDASPDNDLFVVRNIGNQIVTAEGSVEYGVRHLHTPLLLIVGHTGCGAIRAAAGDHMHAPAAVRNELATLAIPKDEPGANSVKLNVHQQVRRAMDKFEAEVLSGELTVVGAIYDLRNDFKQGQGRLVVVDVNGETDPARIAAMELMQAATAPPPKRGRGTSSHRTPR